MSKYRTVAIVIFLALFTFLAYFNSIHAPFMIDDRHMIRDNALLRTPRNIPLFFIGYVTDVPIVTGACRPLLMMTFVLNYSLGKIDPAGYHIVNIFLHFLNGAVLFFLLRLLSKDTSPVVPLLVTLLFLAHPINTEAVTYISSRSDLMATLFIAVAFLLFLKKRYVLTALLYIPALFSKETGLCLPLLIGGYFVLYQVKDTRKLFKNRKEIYLLAGLLSITCIYFVYRWAYFGKGAVEAVRPFISNVYIQAWASLFYIKLFLFPRSLNIFHSFPDLHSLFQIKTLLSVSGIAVLVFLVFALRKKNYLISFGLFWYAIGLLPKFIARLNVPLAEHHLYLPSIGLYMVCAAVLALAGVRRRKFVIYGGIGVILVFSFLTWGRNQQWSNPDILWEKAVESDPGHPANWSGLGLVYRDKGNLEKAIESFEKAIEIDDKYLEAYNNLGLSYSDIGKHKDAIIAYEKALSFDPRNAQAYNNLGNEYGAIGDYERAIALYKSAIELSPNYAKAYNNLGVVYFETGRAEQALPYFKKAVMFDPHDPRANYNLGVVYNVLGKYDEAISYFKKTVVADPRHAGAHNNLAALYYKDGQYSLAIKHCDKARALGFDVHPDIIKALEPYRR